MRVALLTGANPRVSRGGPEVRLLAGRWRIVTEGVKDSILDLHFDDGHVLPVPHPVVANGVFARDDRFNVRLHFRERGTEDHISVFAEKVA